MVKGKIFLCMIHTYVYVSVACANVAVYTPAVPVWLSGTTLEVGTSFHSV